MRKLLLLVSLLCASLILLAQSKKVTTTVDKVVVKESIKLKNSTVTDIDTLITSASSNASLPTSNAVRNYVMSNGAVGLPTLLNKTGKALRVQGSTGSETAVWKDTLPNFYSQDGTITGNRNIDVNNKNLTFNNTNGVFINPNNLTNANSGFFVIGLHNQASIRPTETVIFRGGTGVLTRSLIMSMYDSTRIETQNINGVATFDNKGKMGRHSLSQLLSSIGGGTVSGDGILVKNNTAYLGGTLQDPAPYINRKRIIRYAQDTCTLEFNRNGLGAPWYVPMRFKSQDGLDSETGQSANMKIEFENRDNDNLNTKTHSLKSRYEDFTVFSDSSLLLIGRPSSIVIKEGVIDFTAQRKSGIFSQISFGRNPTGDGYFRLNDWNSTRNDAGIPTSIATFNNQGNLERHPINELKTSLALNAKDVGFTPIANNATYVAIDSNNVQGAIKQVAAYLKNSVPALGAYSPTIVNISPIMTLSGNTTLNYIDYGQVVNVVGEFVVNVISSGSPYSSITISLPVARNTPPGNNGNFVSSYQQAHGIVSMIEDAVGATSYPGCVIPVPNTQNVKLFWRYGSSGTFHCPFNFWYYK
jgi:hypothetical protein